MGKRRFKKIGFSMPREMINEIKEKARKEYNMTRSEFMRMVYREWKRAKGEDGK